VRAKTAEDRQLLELLDPVAEAQGLEIVRLRLMGGTPAAADHGRAPRGRRDRHRAVRPPLARRQRGAGRRRPDQRRVRARGLQPRRRPPADPAEGLRHLRGLEARLETDRLVEGRKRFKGELAGVEGDSVAINLEGETESTALIPFGWLADAKLVLSDALLKRGAEQRAARIAAGEDDEDTDTEEGDA
jgi:ribosome maturation factor RimP